MSHHTIHFKGSKIKMLKFGSRDLHPTSQARGMHKNLLESGKQFDSKTTVPNSRQVLEQAVYQAVPNQGQVVGRSNKHIQTNQNSYKLPKPKNEIEVSQFFKKEKWPEVEAQKFFNHYQSIGWKIGGKIKIEHWHTYAKNWMLKAEELKQDKRKNELSQNQDNLHTTRNKNYNQPL